MIFFYVDHLYYHFRYSFTRGIQTEISTKWVTIKWQTNMAWATGLGEREPGPLGTRKRCGIALCICIFSDLIILGIYWTRIGDALQNPFHAIIESLHQNDTQSESDALQTKYANASIHINGSDPNQDHVGIDRPQPPKVGRMVYHFAATIMYLCYTTMNIIILTNTIFKLYYMKHATPSWNPSSYRILRPFIFDVNSRIARWYFVAVIFLHLIICMDDVLISHTVGFRLPFNELSLEIIRQLTTLTYKAIGHVVNSLFFVFFLLISAIIMMSVKMTIILTSLDDFFGTGPNPRIHVNTNEEEGALNTPARSAVKRDDLPPSYEEETMPPSYDDALVLASIQMKQIHSGSEQE